MSQSRHFSNGINYYSLKEESLRKISIPKIISPAGNSFLKYSLKDTLTLNEQGATTIFLYDDFTNPYLFDREQKVIEEIRKLAEENGKKFLLLITDKGPSVYDVLNFAGIDILTLARKFEKHGNPVLMLYLDAIEKAFNEISYENYRIFQYVYGLSKGEIPREHYLYPLLSYIKSSGIESQLENIEFIDWLNKLKAILYQYAGNYEAELGNGIEDYYITMNNFVEEFTQFQKKRFKKINEVINSIYSEKGYENTVILVLVPETVEPFHICYQGKSQIIPLIISENAFVSEYLPVNISIINRLRETPLDKEKEEILLLKETPIMLIYSYLRKKGVDKLSAIKNVYQIFKKIETKEELEDLILDIQLASRATKMDMGRVVNAILEWLRNEGIITPTEENALLEGKI
jgi:hypothetical protein